MAAQQNVQPLTTNRTLLPGISPEDMRLDGIPTPTFSILMWRKLQNSLGATYHHDHSLKATQDGTDHGGVNQAAALGAPNPAQVRGHEQRVQLLYNVYMSYVPLGCMMRSDIERDFPNLGIATGAFIEATMTIPMAQAVIDALHDEWRNWTAARAGIQHGPNFLFQMLEALHALSQKFPNALVKTPAEMKEKFLTCVPEVMLPLADAEKMNPNAAYVYPNQIQPPALNNGNAHPHAGQCDMRLLVRAWQPVYLGHLQRGAIRGKDGKVIFVSLAGDDPHVDSSEPEMSVCLVCKNKINAFDAAGGDVEADLIGRSNPNRGSPSRSNKTKFANKGKILTVKKENLVKMNCFKCGGVGHAARFKVEGSDEIFVCPTSALAVNLSSQQKDQIRDRVSKKDAKVQNVDSDEDEEEQVAEGEELYAQQVAIEERLAKAHVSGASGSRNWWEWQ